MGCHSLSSAQDRLLGSAQDRGISMGTLIIISCVPPWGWFNFPHSAASRILYTYSLPNMGFYTRIAYKDAWFFIDHNAGFP